MPATRAICLPPAGAGAGIFLPWTAHHAPDIELWAVQLPGREDRALEQPLASLADAARYVSRALQWLGDRPYLLFGHSFGALLAFEVVRLLEEQEAPPPRCLIVSGCAAPGTDTRTDLSLESDGDVLAEAQRLGLPAELLTHGADLIIPALRSDLRMFHSYRTEERPPTACPIAVCVGTDDPHVTPADAAAWAAHTTRFQGMHMLPGAHDYVRTAAACLSALVCRTLGAPVSHECGNAACEAAR